MNLSTPNLSLSSSRCPATSNAGKTTGETSSEGGQGGFEEVFAGLASRSEAAVIVTSPTASGEKATAASPDETSTEAGEELSQVGLDTALDLKKKSGADPDPVLVLGAMVQIFAPVPAEVAPMGVPFSEEVATETETTSPAEGAGNPIAPEAPEIEVPSTGPDFHGCNAAPATVAAAPATRKESREVPAELTESGSVPFEPQPTRELPRPIPVPAPVSAVAVTPEPLAATPVGVQAAQTELLQPRSDPVAPRGKRAETPQLSPTADFAESEASVPEVVPRAKTSSQKNFLTFADKWVAKHVETLGTNVANVASAMSTAPAAQILESVFSKNTLAASVGALAAESGASPLPAPAAALFTGAQHAIEAVFQAGERFTTEAQRSVKMEFSVRGEDLSVRVELHAGEVRTTFHTASAELRSVLAHEWQVLAANDAARTQRFADPVFSTSPSTPTAQGHGGENQGNHRGQEANQPRERFEFSPRSPSGGSAPSTDLPPHSTPAAPLTAHRLHTFA